MITIFSVDSPHPARRLSVFAASLLLHCAILVLVAFGFQYSHRDFTKPIARRYSVQLIHLQVPEQVLSKSVIAPRRDQLSEGEGDVASASRSFQVAPRLHVRTAKQTLVRLDVPPDIVLKHQIPVPAALLWTPNPLQSPPKFLTPPREIPNPAQSLSPPPSLALPSRQLTMADLRMSDTDFPNTPLLPLPPSTTAPIQISGPERGTQLPQTTSPDSQETTAANLISIPAVALRSQSAIVIPPVNQIAFDETRAGSQASGAAQGTGPAFQATEAGFQRAGSSGFQPAVSTTGALLDGKQGLPQSTEPSVAAEPALTRLTLPPNGHFSAVVLGSSASEIYPESAGLLSGNMVYSVYLRVGLHKSWILQYCLPKGSQLNGSVSIPSGIDAPWPFLLLRPDHLTAPETEYVIVHGSISIEGHFDGLALVYPEGLPEKGSLLGALQQWRFRPASREGHPVAVEALLVIPSERE